MLLGISPELILCWNHRSVWLKVDGFPWTIPDLVSFEGIFKWYIPSTRKGHSPLRAGKNSGKFLLEHTGTHQAATFEEQVQ